MGKKICVVTTVHPHCDVRIYFKQAKKLTQAGYSVVVLCPDYAGVDADGIRFRRLVLPESRLRRILSGWRIALGAALDENAVLYHFHDPELLPMAKALKRRGKRVVYDVHEDLPRQILAKQWLPEITRPVISRLAERYENRTASGLDGVVCATQTIADRFPGSVLFRNYPDTEEFTAARYSAYTPYLQRGRNLCYVGAISQVRGITQMLEAIKGLDVRLKLAGSFETLLVRHTVEQMDAYGQVDYQGVLGREEVVALLGQCRIGLLVLQPTRSYRESLPIKLFEYMLAGIPVIASDFDYWRELVDNKAKFVDPKNPEEIREAMEYLLENPDRAKELGEAGRKLVLEKYSLSSEVSRLIKLYERLLKR